MVLHRLEDPGSKRELYRHWLQTVYRPAFDKLQPQHFYRTLDLLAGNKDRIETALFKKARDLFTLDLDLVLWDTTSTYDRRPGTHRDRRKGPRAGREIRR